MSELLFASDNAAGLSAEVMEALARADRGTALPYGNDDLTSRVNELYSAFFERAVFVFPTGTGTAANALALAAVTPPYGEILCHSRAHVLTTEGGAPEFYTGGARLAGLDCEDGLITVGAFSSNLAGRTPSKHHMRVAAVSLTQATEAGTVYRPTDVATLAERAHAHEMKVHMDGARLANALVALDVTPAQMTWQCGVDVLSLGTTKNGTLNAEAVIAFDCDMARGIAYRHKRAGLLVSKMRYVAAQLIAYLEQDLWARNARRANRAAARLAQIFASLPGARLRHPVQTNQVFVELPSPVITILDNAGIRIRQWAPGEPPVYRLVTSYQTTDADVQRVADAFAEGFPAASRFGEPR